MFAPVLKSVLAFLAVQCGAVTDVTTLTAAANTSHLVPGGVTAETGKMMPTSRPSTWSLVL